MTLTTPSEGIAKGTAAFDSLMQISCLANKSLVLDEVLPETLAGIADLVHADRLAVLLEDSGMIAVRATWIGSRDRAQANGKQVFSKSDYPLLCPREVINYEWGRDGNPPIAMALPYVDDGKPVRALLVPLEVDDFVIGRLDIIRHGDQHGFDGAESRFARACARILSLALRNGMEYARVAWLASHDPLTGIGNRRAFDAAFSREISRAERYGRSLSLLLIDLDDFKDANTRLGLSGGDEILRRIGSVLAKGARQGIDVPCRIGGDEFALVLPELNEASADELVQRLMNEVIRVTTPLWPMRFSYSIATYPGVSAPDLRRSADVRLRDAKSRKQDNLPKAVRAVQ